MVRTAHWPKLHTDIKPVLTFRANAAQLIEQVKSSGRPLVLTQRGHSTAVVLDVGQYEQMLAEIDLLRDIQIAARRVDAGQGVANREAKAALRRRFGR